MEFLDDRLRFTSYVSLNSLQISLVFASVQIQITESCGQYIPTEINPVMLYLRRISVTRLFFCGLESKGSFACSDKTGY